MTNVGSLAEGVRNEQWFFKREKATRVELLLVSDLWFPLNKYIVGVCVRVCERVGEKEKKLQKDQSWFLFVVQSDNCRLISNQLIHRQTHTHTRSNSIYFPDLCMSMFRSCLSSIRGFPGIFMRSRADTQISSDIMTLLTGRGLKFQVSASLPIFHWERKNICATQTNTGNRHASFCISLGTTVEGDGNGRVILWFWLRSAINCTLDVSGKKNKQT